MKNSTSDVLRSALATAAVSSEPARSMASPKVQSAYHCRVIVILTTMPLLLDGVAQRAERREGPRPHRVDLGRVPLERVVRSPRRR